MQNLPDLEPLVRSTSRGDKRSEERLFGILYKFVQSVIRKRWRSSLSEDEIADIVGTKKDRAVAIEYRSLEIEIARVLLISQNFVGVFLGLVFVKLG